MLETIITYLMVNWPFTTGALIVIIIGLSGALLSEYREKKQARLKQHQDLK